MNSGVSFTISRGQTVHLLGALGLLLEAYYCIYPALSITKNNKKGEAVVGGGRCARAVIERVVVASSLKHCENERKLSMMAVAGALSPLL